MLVGYRLPFQEIASLGVRSATPRPYLPRKNLAPRQRRANLCFTLIKQRRSEEDIQSARYAPAHSRP